MPANKRLTHWAAVAFSARCAEHMLPILESVWPDRDERSDGMFCEALSAAKISARTGKLIPHYPDIDESITMLAGRLYLAGQGIIDDDTLPANKDTWGIIEDIATVFAKTSEAAHAPARQSQEIAIEGFSWAQKVATKDRDLAVQMHSELELLFKCCPGWNDRTGVTWDGVQWTGTTPRSWWSLFGRNGK